MNPFYCEGLAHDNAYPAPVLGYADHPERVHALCNVCAKAAREAQAKDNSKPLHQYIGVSAATAKSRLEAGETPQKSRELSDLEPMSPRTPLQL